MDRRCLVVWLLVSLTDKVSSQVKVEGVKGGKAVLPCVYTKTIMERDMVTIFWRLNDEKKVYDVAAGNTVLTQQDPEFKARAQTFPEEYSKGNYSLSLRDLRVTDVGTYFCYIPPLNVKQQIQLHVEDGPEARSSSMRASLVPAVLLCLILLL
ncbi:CD276 antigen homolog [Chanos chanos]|uniref:CD276 antigen homolog n=1 Tax=Chanos chanos TaxID=29144 RepID=A0A6J2VWG1_CHACN|nr:CD276 antigen homolog [Chanos chanos]